MSTTEIRFDEELYKHLLQENAKYIEQVHQTWNQKLLFVGSMVAFILVNQDTLKDGATLPLQIVIIAIPVMCVLLDAHMFEKALQARIISHIVISEFEDKKQAKPWCNMFWAIGHYSGDKPRGPLFHLFRFWFQRQTENRIDALVGVRSATTTVVSYVPTVLVLFMAAYALDPSGHIWTIPMLAAGVVSTLYLVAANVLFRKLRLKVQEGSRRDAEKALG